MSSTSEYNRQYYIKNRDRVLARNKAWNAAHPEVMAAIENAWNENNPGRKAKRIAAWAKSHPEAIKVKFNKHRAKMLGNGGSFTVCEWESLCKKYNYRCLDCGKRKKLEADHIIPVSKGGTSNIDNIQPLCRTCNARKGTKTTDFRRRHGCGFRKSKTRRRRRAASSNS
jgi:5-methylcytosine-specific restriction endonuclease McrA